MTVIGFSQRQDRLSNERTNEFELRHQEQEKRKEERQGKKLVLALAKTVPLTMGGQFQQALKRMYYIRSDRSTVLQTWPSLTNLIKIDAWP